MAPKPPSTDGPSYTLLIDNVPQLWASERSKRPRAVIRKKASKSSPNRDKDATTITIKTQLDKLPAELLTASCATWQSPRASPPPAAAVPTSSDDIPQPSGSTASPTQPPATPEPARSQPEDPKRANAVDAVLPSESPAIAVSPPAVRPATHCWSPAVVAKQPDTASNPDPLTPGAQDHGSLSAPLDKRPIVPPDDSHDLLIRELLGIAEKLPEAAKAVLKKTIPRIQKAAKAPENPSASPSASTSAAIPTPPAADITNQPASSSAPPEAASTQPSAAKQQSNAPALNTQAKVILLPKPGKDPKIPVVAKQPDTASNPDPLTPGAQDHGTLSEPLAKRPGVPPDDSHDLLIRELLGIAEKLPEAAKAVLKKTIPRIQKAAKAPDNPSTSSSASSPTAIPTPPAADITSHPASSLAPPEAVSTQPSAAKQQNNAPALNTPMALSVQQRTPDWSYGSLNKREISGPK
ncbi:nascent polypeptide-associated complex subunit alpha, muscle-specific form-like [Ischnura elegans]|uniref:nascent polypeptide-associated complex subunit alpha, muscle-specific form-like n=1 Tax=Ischnura elegans TaxID=197161 RepID=UPI001ED8A1FD|nr:nascent polypeptide-associated complex subunit alpha, muscle-specific form-like [Ischnura elegans]